MKQLHPGQILKSQYMLEEGVSGLTLSKEIGMSASSINRLVQGKASMSVEMAHKLSARFGNEPRDWLTMQMEYDLDQYRPTEIKTDFDLFNAIGVSIPSARMRK